MARYAAGCHSESLRLAPRKAESGLVAGRGRGWPSGCPSQAQTRLRVRVVTVTSFPTP